MRTAVASLIASLWLVGCQSGYVIEQGLGQLGLTFSREDLDDPALVARLSDEARERLALVPEILEFARERLGLDPGDAYTTILDTGGEPISHIVIACHPLALVPYEWCFPIVGCVPYKGYFDEEDAISEARRLRDEGWDVDLRGVEAYSTLGWFSDPVLSTMLDLPTLDLVDLLIHETVHRTLYLPGSTEINESLATYVAAEGTQLFVETHPEIASAEDVAAWKDRQERRQRLGEVIARLRDDLDSLYRSQLSPDRKLLRKREMFETASAALTRLEPESSRIPATNAYVLLADRYFGLVPEFRRLQDAEGLDLAGLIALLVRMNEDEPERLARLFSEDARVVSEDAPVFAEDAPDS